MAVDKKLIIELVAKADQFTKTMNDVTTNTQKISQGYTGLKDSWGKDSDKMLQSIGMLGTGLEGMGNKLTTYVTAPLIGLGALAVKEFSSYESSWAGVTKTVDGSTEQLASLRGELDQLARDIPSPISAIHGVAEAAGQLGISFEAIPEFTRVMTNLGVSTNLTAEEAATALARFSSIMGVVEEDYEKLGSVIVGLGNNYATTEKEIVNLATRLAGAGAVAGLSAAEVLGISTALSSVGISAEAGGTAMSKFMTTTVLAAQNGIDSMAKLEKQTGYTGRDLQLMASNNSKEFKSLADSLGMTTTELNNIVKNNKDLKAMAEIAGMTEQAFADLVKLDLAGAMDAFFSGLGEANVEGASSLGILQEMGISEVRLRDMILRSAQAKGVFTSAVADARTEWEKNTALEEESQKRYATLASQLTLMWNNVKLLLVAIGEQLAPYIKDFAQWVGELAQKIQQLSPKQVQDLLKVFLGFAAVGPILKIVGSGMNAFITWNKFLGLFSKGAGDATKALTTTADASKGLAGSLGKLSGASLMKAGGWAALGVYAFDFGKNLGNLIGTFTSIKNASNDTAKGVDKDAKSMIDSFNPFYKLKEGALDPLMNFFTDLPQKMGGVTTTWTDLGVGIAGVIGIATGVAPIMGGVALALSGLNIFVKEYQREVALANNEVIAWDESLQGSIKSLEAQTTVFDELAEKHVPALTESFDALKAVRVEDLLPTEKDFRPTFEAMDNHNKNLVASINETYDTMREATRTFYADYDKDNKEGLEKELQEIETSRNSRLNIVETSYATLLEKQKQYGEDNYIVTEEDLASYNELLETMTAAGTQILVDKIDLRTESMALSIKRQMELGNTLTVEQFDSLATLVEEGSQLIEDKDEEAYAKRLAQIDVKYAGLTGKEKEKEEERQRLFEEYNQLRYTRESEALVKYMGLITGATEEEIRERIQRNIDLEDQLKVQQGIMDKYADSALGTEERSKYDKAREWSETLQELIKHNQFTEDELNALARYLETHVDPEMQKAMGLINGRFEMSAALSTLKKSIPELIEEFEKSAKYAVEGVARGFKNNEYIATDEVGRFASRLNQKFDRTLDIRSPSRVFAKSGKYIVEGVAMGISDNARLAQVAVTTLADNLANTNFVAPEVVANVVGKYTQPDVDDIEQGISPLAQDVANALSINPIRAFIVRDDVDTEIDRKLQRDKRREEGL